MKKYPSLARLLQSSSVVVEDGSENNTAGFLSIPSLFLCTLDTRL